MADVTAFYTVQAATRSTLTLSGVGYVLADTDLDAIARHLTDNAPATVALCRDCGRHLVDPARTANWPTSALDVGELTSFVVDGRRYGRVYRVTDQGDIPIGWARVFPSCPTCEGRVCAVGAEDSCPGCCECLGHCIGEPLSTGDGESRG